MKKTQEDSHLGRNPFGKSNPKKKTKDVKAEKVKTTSPSKRLKPKVADWLLVELPAESYLLGLKTVLLTKEIFEKRRSS